MTTDGYRQEVFNVLLAQLLQERGVVSAPERIIRSGPEQARRMPDVIVSFHGLRMGIEGEVSDRSHAKERALESALKRLEEGIVHIGIALVYPSDLRTLTFSDLKSELARSELHMAIVTESEDTGFVTGTVDHLESALRHAFQQLVREDVVAGAVETLDAGIGRFSEVIEEKPGVMGRVAETLGIREVPRAPSTAEETSG
jgi:hypothetical protein